MTAILVTLDGVRPDAIQQAKTPTLDKIMKQGCYTMEARSVEPSLTLPCHMSIFHSVNPHRHGVLSNNWQPPPQLLTGLCEVIRVSGGKTAMIYGWEPLRNLALPGTIDFAYYERLDFDNLERADDPIVDVAVDRIKSRQYTLVFVYIGATDEIGHRDGWMSEPYLRQVEIADEQVGRLVAAMDRKQDFILVESDHGGHGKRHGEIIPEDMIVPWMVMGKGVRPNKQIREIVRLVDTAPTLVSLLGYMRPRDWDGFVIGAVLDELYR